MYTRKRYTQKVYLRSSLAKNHKPTTKMDLFENTVLCKNCGKKMKLVVLDKDGFRIRALRCPSCSNQILHPSDVEEYKKFKELRGRHFQVKLRLVGNSYTVSIPREIVNFMREENEEEEPKREDIHSKMRDHMARQMQEMQQFVTLAMEEANKLSLMFTDNESSENIKTEKKEQDKRVQYQGQEDKPKFHKIGGIKIKKSY